MKFTKHILFSAMLLTGSIIAKAQHGFVQTDVIKTSNVTTDSQVFGLSATDRQTSRVFYDGLGRPLQAVGVKAGAGSTPKDIVQPVVYDALGMQPKAYLPFLSNYSDGRYQDSVIIKQSAFYSNGRGDKVADNTKPWSAQIFDNSPMKNLLLSGSVGNAYQPDSGTHFKKINYRTNTVADSVVVWPADGSTTTAKYFAGTLKVSDAYDEEGIESVVYTDDAGRMIMKKQAGPSSTWLKTYYIYSDAGQLNYMIPPKATQIMSVNGFSISTSGVSSLIFKYVYDDRGRLVEKTVPGAGVVYIVYDKYNRPVLTQDANLRSGNKWVYIKYDPLGRVISQGIYTDATHTVRTNGSTGMQDYVNGLSNTWYENRSATPANSGYYTNNAFPTTNISALTYAYYDDYDIDYNGTVDYSYSTRSLTNEATATDKTRGLLTAVFKRSVGSGLSTMWFTSVYFYDKRGNAIQAQSNNQLNNAVSDVATSVPDFTGKPQQTQTVVYSGSTTHTDVLTTFTYDQMSRVTAVDQKYNAGSTIRVAGYTYNALGQLVDKQLHSTNGGSTWLQSIDYRYDIRGRLTNMNNATLSDDHANPNLNTNDESNDVFGLEIYYDQSAGTSNTLYYNGRLSAVKWMSKDASGTAGNQRNYNFAYDVVDRMTAATYQEKDKITGSWVYAGGYDEKNITYDQNGNILTLKRNTLVGTTVTEIDNLNYNYNGNQLKNITDGTGSTYTGAGFRNYASDTTSYHYDGNGNMDHDYKKAITLAYNDLNRTDKVTLNAYTNRYIDYTYDAAGQLVRKRVYDSGTLQSYTDYIGGFVFIGGTLKYFAVPEGRVRNNSGTLKNEYVITDHQGNARISFEDNGSGSAVVRQENSYYPFGLAIGNSPVSKPTDDNKHLYNAGAEIQDDYGDLPGFYQTFYRNYDPALGRFMAVDPLADQLETLSTYEYANNNPAMLNDPMGDKFDTNSEWQYKTPYTDNLARKAADRTSQETGDMALSGMNFGTDVITDDDGSYTYLGGTYGGRYKTDPETALATQAELNRQAVDRVNRQTQDDASGGKGVYIYIDGNGVVSFQDSPNGHSSLQKYNSGTKKWDAYDGPPTKKSAHDLELEKYGYVTGGFNISGTLSLAFGGIGEIGWVSTNKNWVQYYRTTYFTQYVGAGVAGGPIVVVNKGKNKTTFSDWAGPIYGIVGNIGVVGAAYGTSNTYNSYTVGPGIGWSLPKFGSYTVGYTTLMGSPINMNPDAVDITKSYFRGVNYTGGP